MLFYIISLGFFYTKLPIFSWIGYYFILKINSVEMYTSYKNEYITGIHYESIAP